MDDSKKFSQTPGEPAPAADLTPAAEPASAPEPASTTVPEPVVSQTAQPATAPDAAAVPVAAPPAPQAPPAPMAPQQPSFGQQQVPPTTPGSVPPPPPGSVPPQGPGTIPPPPGQQYYAAPNVAPTSSGKAVGALVCGILSILFSFLIIPGIILGIVALVLASGASKIGLRDGKITAGRVTAAIGLILSAIMLVLSLALGAIVGAIVGNSDRIEDVLEHSYTDIYDGSYGETFDPSNATEEEAAVNDAVVAEADRLLSQDPTLMSAISLYLDDEMRDMTEYEFPPNGISLTELGIDPSKFASWVLQNATYTVSDLYVYSAIDSADATLRFTVPDRHQFSDAYYDAFYSKDLGVSPTDPTYADLAKSAVSASLDEAMAATTGTEEATVFVELERTNGTWVLDADWYEDLFDEYLY